MSETDRGLVPIQNVPFTYRTLEAVAHTEFVPKALRRNVPALLAAVMAGREIGLPPMMALRSIDVIDGNPQMSGELMLSIVRGAGHKIRFTEYGNEKVTALGVRGEDPDDTMAVTWTMDDARRAGLAGKSNWKNYPRTMLAWRAVTELCRFHFPDVLAAKLNYTPEEFGDSEWHDEGPIDTIVADAPKRDAVDDLVVEEDAGDDNVEDAEIIEGRGPWCGHGNQGFCEECGDLTRRAEKPQIVDTAIAADEEPATSIVDPGVNERPIPAEPDPAPDDPFDLSGGNPANPADRAAAGAPVDVDPPSDDELDQAWSVIYATLGNPGEIVAGNMDQVRTRVRNLFAGMATVGLWPDTGSGRAIELACLKHFGTRHVSELRRDQLDEFARVSVDAAARVVEDHGRQDQLSV